jgi:hypothetical protein
MKMIFSLAFFLAAAPFVVLAEDELWVANGKAMLGLLHADDNAIEFVLAAGVAAGETQCIEGNVDCISIKGTAVRSGDGYIFEDMDFPGSGLIILPTEGGYEIRNVTGDFGTGSANRQLLGDIAGLYSTAGNVTSVQESEIDYNIVSPSGNIECNLWTNGKEELRCDMGALTYSFPEKPEDCPVDWGSSFGMFSTGSAEVLCVGDTIVGPQKVVLDYGLTVQYGSFSCTSEKTGLTCRNLDGHGFTLSKAKQTLF